MPMLNSKILNMHHVRIGEVFRIPNYDVYYMAVGRAGFVPDGTMVVDLTTGEIKNMDPDKTVILSNLYAEDR